MVIRKIMLSFVAKGTLTPILLTILVWGGARAQEQVDRVNPGPIAFENAIENVSAAILPAVVHIEVEREVVHQLSNPFQEDPFFRYFFEPGPEASQQGKTLVRGLGTGMIIDANGHILTNNHVVGEANRVTVKLSSGVELSAQIVGTDAKTDLAIIKVNPSREMKYISFGDSDRLRIGQWVVAIGSPRGLDQTVTVGVVSAMHRRGVGLLGPSGYEDYIQTDAAINPGNSGGPLVNLRGEVIGVNSAILSSSGGFQGIGFAVPSKMASAVAKALISQGEVIRGWMGVSIQKVTPDIVNALGLEESDGVLVTDVTTDSPAAKSGIERGDVIVEYDGRTVSDVSEYRQLVAATETGREVKVGLVRRGREMELFVKVESQAGERELIVAGEVEIDIGVRVENITSEVARRLRMRSREGVVITLVAQGSPAAQAGLDPGDVILSINNEGVRGLNDYNSIMSQLEKGDALLMLVRNIRDGSIVYLVVKTG